MNFCLTVGSVIEIEKKYDSFAGIMKKIGEDNTGAVVDLCCALQKEYDRGYFLELTPGELLDLIKPAMDAVDKGFSRSVESAPDTSKE